MTTLTTTAVITFITNTITPVCPDGWTFHNESCYLLFETAMTHFQAQAYCLSQNPVSRLIYIESLGELYWLQFSFIPSYLSNDRIWV